MKPSADYDAALDATRRFHARNKGFSGRFMIRYWTDIDRLIREFGCRTMLDYGCGRGVQYEMPEIQEGLAAAGITHVQKYDPGVGEFSEEPRGQYDLVICTQVLGSIPIPDLQWVLGRLCGFASRAVYIGERIGPVRKRLHAFLGDKMPHEWPRERWVEEIRRVPRPVPVFFRTMGSEDWKGRCSQVAGPVADPDVDPVTGGTQE